MIVVRQVSLLAMSFGLGIAAICHADPILCVGVDMFEGIRQSGPLRAGDFLDCSPQNTQGVDIPNAYALAMNAATDAAKSSCYEKYTTCNVVRVENFGILPTPDTEGVWGKCSVSVCVQGSN